MISGEGMVALEKKDPKPANDAEKAWVFFERGVEAVFEVNIKE